MGGIRIGRQGKEAEKQLEQIAGSYDRSIDLGRKGTDLYENLPACIMEHPGYDLFLDMQRSGTLSDSGRKEIISFLSPMAGMKFIDLGCCLNLMFRGYGDWPSDYYGVDISGKTIELLHEFVHKDNIEIGSLYCGSMADTPYDPGCFDIGACIGSLEYFEKDYVEQAIAEAHRIIKPGGKFVLDIPDAGSPEFEITKLIEEYMGRPDLFNISVKEFEVMLKRYFKIDTKEKVGPMIQYFLVNYEEIV